MIISQMPSPEQEKLIMGLLDILKIDDPSDYDDYYESIDWHTHHIDTGIFNPYAKPDRTEQRILTYMLQKAREECMDLKWQLARSGSDSYKYSAEEMTRLQAEMNQISRKNARLEAENAAMKEQIAYLRGHTSDRGMKAAVDQQYGFNRQASTPAPAGASGAGRYEVIEILNPVPERNIHQPQAQQPRSGTRFASKNGATKQENMMTVAAYWENGYDAGEIAEQLDLSVGSVRAYLSTIKKHYRVEIGQHGKEIQFDKAYGDVRWNLAFYERTHLKRVSTGD